ncbi:hypothetical protein [Tolypothrix sp. VBCCA 56010]|uniref:hypothetical protein n=1 Tax=Tolypothrix sp. VBCCA 56010 TaxID=3137731 RepID=UPI003D7ED4DB
MNTFLSGVAVLLSTLALMCSGYAAYQVFTLQQTLNSTKTATNIAPIPIPSATPTETPTAAIAPAPVTTTTSTLTPGQFVQPAFGNKAKVELLSLKRIKDPESGNRDVVNVQMRVRRVIDRVTGSDIISIASTTARNPDTSETYKAVAYDRSTGSVSLFGLRTNSSADAYVWLRIPEGVNNLDIFVPDTAAFQNVPISN